MRQRSSRLLLALHAVEYVLAVRAQLFKLDLKGGGTTLRASFIRCYRVVVVPSQECDFVAVADAMYDISLLPSEVFVLRTAVCTGGVADRGVFAVAEAFPRLPLLVGNVVEVVHLLVTEASICTAFFVEELVQCTSEIFRIFAVYSKFDVRGDGAQLSIQEGVKLRWGSRGEVAVTRYQPEYVGVDCMGEELLPGELITEWVLRFSGGIPTLSAIARTGELVWGWGDSLGEDGGERHAQPVTGLGDLLDKTACGLPYSGDRLAKGFGGGLKLFFVSAESGR